MAKDKEYLTEKQSLEVALSEQEKKYLKQKKTVKDPHGRQDVFVDRRDPERNQHHSGKERRSNKTDRRNP